MKIKNKVAFFRDMLITVSMLPIAIYLWLISKAGVSIENIMADDTRVTVFLQTLNVGSFLVLLLEFLLMCILPITILRWLLVGGIDILNNRNKGKSKFELPVEKITNVGFYIFFITFGIFNILPLIGANISIKFLENGISFRLSTFSVWFRVLESLMWSSIVTIAYVIFKPTIHGYIKGTTPEHQENVENEATEVNEVNETNEPVVEEKMPKLKKSKKWLVIISNILIFFLVFLASFVQRGDQFLYDTFGKVGIDAIIFHLSMPLEGTGNGMIADFINAVIVPSVLLALLAQVMYLLLYKYRKTIFEVAAKLSVNHLVNASKIVASILLIGAVWSAYDRLGVSDYIAFITTTSSFIEENYVDPRTANISFPEDKRNLIYIYLESMETSFMSAAEGGGSPTNMIPELELLAREHHHFSNKDGGLLGGAHQMSGLSWTMAGMFGTTAGVPLIIPLGNNQMTRVELFAPGVYPLGSILQENGYSNYLMVGSDAEFGGRKNYFTQHGDYEIYDVFTAEVDGIIEEGRRVFWGFEDYRLFDYAKMVLTEISQNDEPFNFTMLTVDTHYPDGWPTEFTPDIYDRQYNNVIRGSSTMIDEFVTWITEQDFYENTTIVLTGDHLTMQKDMTENLDEGFDRIIFNAIIQSQVEGLNYNNRTFTNMDMFPTVVEALGATVEGRRLGLGTSLYSDLETLPEIYGLDYIDQQVQMRSPFFNDLLTREIKDEEIVKNEK